MRARLSTALFCVSLALSSLPSLAGSTRETLFLSDLHLGVGRSGDEWNRIEDFRWRPALAFLLDEARRQFGEEIDLVLLGDVFELWQSPTMSCSADPQQPGCHTVDCDHGHPEHGCTPAEALQRLRHIMAAHADTIEALRLFGSGRNRVFFVPGNHDAALLLPELRSELQRAFIHSNVFICPDPSGTPHCKEPEGAWMSTDGMVYAEHGHQGDDVNRWEAWPAVLVKDEGTGTSFLRRPWGENMVQRFFNQYEAMFPVLDNLLDERDGIDFAIETGGLALTAEAVGRFFRFFLFEQSLSQASDSLGRETAMFDIKAVRAKPPEFFADVLYAWKPVADKARSAAGTGKLQLDLRTMNAQELQRLCHIKQARRERGDKNVSTCPRKKDGLGAAIKGMLFTPKELLGRYLAKSFRRWEVGDTVPKVYVYGHTHRAAPPEALELLMANGPTPVVVANTGAFQRVASAAQLKSALAVAREKNPGATYFDLTPDDLPDCHTFVRIRPYENGDTPTPELWHVLGDGQQRKMLGGGCPR